MQIIWKCLVSARTKNNLTTKNTTSAACRCDFWLPLQMQLESFMPKGLNHSKLWNIVILKKHWFLTFSESV